MGGGESFPVLPDNQKFFAFVGENVGIIPFRIRPNHPVTSMNLQKNRLRILPTQLTNLKTLVLSDNEITEISDSLRAGLVTYISLEVLDLSRNQLTTFDIDIKSLKNLDLSQNRLATCPHLSSGLVQVSMDFNMLKKLSVCSNALKRLTISVNSITEIEEGLTFPSLELLDISMNRLSSLNKFAEMFPVLKSGNFSNNMLKSVPEHFSTRLVTLNLSQNQIEVLPDSIAELEHLELLDVSKNALKKIGKLPRSLQGFIASHNRIVEVSELDVPSLESADFADNQLAHVPQMNNHRCQTVSLRRNMLTDVSIVLASQTIEQLYLEQNRIESLPAELFSLPKLRFLNVGSNCLKSLPSEIETSNLTFLNVSENPITSLPTMPATMEIVLAGLCQLTAIDHVFDKAEKLARLDLSGNKITGELPSHETLQVLSLSECNLEKCPTFPPKLTHLDLSRNKLTEIPADFTSQTLRCIDLSCNAITVLPNFQRFPRLSILKLAHNDFEGSIDIHNLRSFDSLDVCNTKVQSAYLPISIRETLTTADELPKQGNYRKFVCTRSSYAQTIGTREEMEDAVCVRDDLNMCLVADGHGGSRCATMIANRIGELLAEKHEFGGDFLRSVIIKVNAEMKRQRVKDGTSLAMYEINERQLLAANVGDSKVIMVSEDGTAKCLTRDHKPTMRKEFERVIHAGGRVSSGRTNGTLPVSRTLGDFDVPGISNEPEIAHIFLEDQNRFLIVCVDAVTDVLTEEELAQITLRAASTTEAAFEIRNRAMARGNDENVSVVVTSVAEFIQQ